MLKGRGFTLIELVMIIIILAILAIVAIPRFIDLTDEANAAAEAGVVGGVRGGIHTFFAENRVWPTELDDSAAADNSADAYFDNVLAQGGLMDGQWTKVVLTYTGPGGGSYTYVPATGDFE